MTASANCALETCSNSSSNSNNKDAKEQHQHRHLSTEESRTTTTMLPKESELAGRKRPLAIQELLEKKRARLAPPRSAEEGTALIAEEEADGDKSEKSNLLEQQSEDQLEQNELAELVKHLYNGGEDSETTSSGSADSANNKCAPPEESFEKLLRRAMLKSNLIRPEEAIYASILASEGEQADQTKTETTPTKTTEAKCSPSKSTSAEVNESPLSKFVPHDKMFAQVPGRLSLLSNVVKYKMTVGEVKRRLMGPEAFNFSLLGALLRRAKMPEKSQMLVDELSQVGLTIPRGRRRLSQITLLSALTEAEAVQFSKDFKKIAESEFPSQEMAVEMSSKHQKKDVVEVKARLEKLTSALKVTTEFLELLQKDRSPVMESKLEPVLPDELQTSLQNFSMLTHGFGNPAIQVGISCFIQMLQQQIQCLEARSFV